MESAITITDISKIIERIREKTAMPAYQLILAPDRTPDLFDSKFGGVPYWDFAKEYPLDSNGNKMMLLAQLNFTKAALKDARLPKSGMLQFFIRSDDDCFGMNFDVPDEQKDFRVIFHETIDESVTEAQILALDIPCMIDEPNDYTPVYRQSAVDFLPTTACLGADAWGFSDVCCAVIREITGDTVPDNDLYSYLGDSNYEKIYNALQSSGHRVLGYPVFTQADPREDMDEETAAYYDTLLFQMDSDSVNGEDVVLWGDCGVANFFINGEALKRHDFDRVVYNWDCC